MKRYEFTRKEHDDIDGATASLMLFASAVLNDEFPDQWEQGMQDLADKIRQQIQDNRPDDGPSLRLIE